MENITGETSKVMFLPMFFCNIIFWGIALATIFKIPLKHKEKESEKKIKLKDMIVRDFLVVIVTTYLHVQIV